MNMKRLLNILIPVIPVALILGTMMFSHSCANTTTPPSGGPKDTIPPIITKLDPLDGSVNVPTHKTKLEFTFNEYVVESRYAPTISDIVKGAKKIQEENEKVLTRVRNTFVEICDMWGAKKSKELYDIFCDLVELNGPDLNKSLRIALDMKEAAIEYIKDKGVLVVGITDFAPMDYQENGEWVGFDADMARLVAEKLGVECEFVVIEWDAKIMELDSKAIDVVWNGMTISDEVKAAMDLSNAYCNNACLCKILDYSEVLCRFVLR